MVEDVTQARKYTADEIDRMIKAHAEECTPAGCGWCGYECPKFPIPRHKRRRGTSKDVTQKARELLADLKDGMAAQDLIFYRMPSPMVDDLIEVLSALLGDEKP